MNKFMAFGLGVTMLAANTACYTNDRLSILVTPEFTEEFPCAQIVVEAQYGASYYVENVQDPELFDDGSFGYASLGVDYGEWYDSAVWRISVSWWGVEAFNEGNCFQEWEESVQPEEGRTFFPSDDIGSIECETGPGPDPASFFRCETTNLGPKPVLSL